MPRGKSRAKKPDLETKKPAPPNAENCGDRANPSLVQNEMQVEYNEAVKSFYVALKDMKEDLVDKKGYCEPLGTPDVKKLFASSTNVVVQELCYKIFSLEGQLSNETPATKKRRVSEDVSNLKAHIHAQNVEMTDQLNKIEELKSVMQSQSEELASCKEKISKRKAQLAAAKTEGDEWENRLQALQLRNESLREQEQQTKKKLQEVEENLQSSNTRMGQIFTAQRKLLAEKSQLTLTVDRLAKTNECLTKDVSAEHEKTVLAEKRASDAKQQLEDAIFELKNCCKIDANCNLAQLVARIKQIFEEYKQMVNRLKTSYEDLKVRSGNELHELRAKISFESNVHSERAKKLCEQAVVISNLKKKVCDDNAVREMVSRENRFLKNELTSAKKAIEGVDADFKKRELDFSNRVKRLESSLSTQTTISKNHKEANKKLEYDLQVAKAECDSLKASKNRLTNEVSAAQEKLKPFRKTMQDLQVLKESNEKLTNEVRRWQLEAAKAKSQLLKVQPDKTKVVRVAEKVKTEPENEPPNFVIQNVVKLEPSEF